MSDGTDDFVQLNRTFHDLGLSEEEGKEPGLFRLMGRGAPLTWAELLREPRAVVLSEAGSGKTEEIRHACLDLRREKKHAFFLRIEHLVQDFETSFELGNPLTIKNSKPISLAGRRPLSVTPIPISIVRSTWRIL